MFSHLMQLKSYLIALSLVMLSLVLANPAHAITATFTGTVDSSDPIVIYTGGYWCEGYFERHSFSVTETGSYTLTFDSLSFTVVDEPNADLYAFVSTSPTLTNHIAFTRRSGTGFNYSQNNPVRLTAGVSYYIFFSDCAHILHFQDYASATYSLSLSDPTIIPVDTDSGDTDSSANITMPPDNRINWQFGDSSAVIYPHEDGVTIYCYNGNTWLAMAINQEIVDGWDTNQPQETPVLEVNHAGCQVAFYILDDGQYQINIWSFEGKRYEIIADNIHFENAEMRYFDPNE